MLINIAEDLPLPQQHC